MRETNDTQTVATLLREYAKRAALCGNPYRAKACARAADALAALVNRSKSW